MKGYNVVLDKGKMEEKFILDELAGFIDLKTDKKTLKINCYAENTHS